ncbi:MAG: TonB-dependent receptor [Pseudomonadota bacterium]
MDAVTVIGHYDNAVGKSDAASQGSVTATLIANRPTERTGEILEFVPGLIVSQHSGDGKANQYYLRGFNLDHGTDFATFVDGMPVNMRSHAHGHGYSDLNFLIPELVTRIDYKKGPYFADEGDFASAGAAHLYMVDTLPLGIASLTVGANQYARGLLAQSVAAGSGKLLYALDLAHNNGPWDNTENFRKFNGLLRYSDGSRSDGYSLTAMAYTARWNATDQIPQRAVDAGLLGRFGAVDTSDGGESSRYSLSYALRKPNALGQLAFNAYVVQSSLDLFSNFTYFMDDPVNGDQFHQRERRDLAGFALRQTWPTRWGGLDVVNSFGLQGRHDRIAPLGLYTTTAQVRTGITREDQVQENSLGVFVENTVQWLPKFRSIVGLRHDAYTFDVASNIAANSGNVASSVTSPKLSLVLGPWAQTEYFANWGEGFHSNDARGTTATLTPKELLPTTPVTPVVKTRGAELGLRTEIIPGLQSSLALWQLTLGSELVFLGDAGDTSPNRPSRRQGVEWNNHYKLSDWLLIDADLALSQARYTEDDAAGNHVPGSIEQVASFGISLTDYKNWFGSLQLRYFGPRPLLEDNSVRSAATALTNLRVGYKFGPRTRLTLDVFNLFNREASDIDYFYASQLRSESSPVEGVTFHPVEPRALRLSLVHNF